MTSPRKTTTGWELKLRHGGDRASRLKMPEMSEPAARDRARRLEAMRDLLVKAGIEAEQFLRKAALAPSDELFTVAEETAREEVALRGKAKPKAPRTFRDMCEMFLSGEMHRLYPDRIPERQADTDKRDAHRLGRICKTIGNIPLTSLTRADCERALAELPSHLMGSTRARYAGLIPRVLWMAELGGFIDRSPLPARWTPKAGDRREFQFLYPSEDATLIRCRKIPIERRLLWGFLVRTGLRISEARRLTWSDIDFDRRTIVVRKSKTGSMRRFRLRDDVVLALEAERERTGAGGEQRVFIALSYRTAMVFRKDLHDCEQRRRELHEPTAESRHITVHDLRGSFVTVNLALGKPEQYIMDRTGHRSSKMLHVYDRASRYAVDHEMGDYVPLHTGLYPGRGRDGDAENALETNVGTGQDCTGNPGETSGKASFPAEPVDPTQSLNRPVPVQSEGAGQSVKTKGPGQPAPEQTKGAAAAGAVPQSQAPVHGQARGTETAAAPADPLAQAIADLAHTIRLAAEAGQWPLVARLTGQLEALKVARAGVTSLDDVRGRKNGGDK